MLSTPVQVRYNDLKLYEERTDPDGPAMTHSMFAIGWLDLGEKKKAEKPFLKNYENIRGPFKVTLLSAHRSSNSNCQVQWKTHIFIINCEVFLCYMLPDH